MRVDVTLMRVMLRQAHADDAMLDACARARHDADDECATRKRP